MKWFFLLLAMTVTTAAQDFTMMVDSNSRFVADWAKVTKCAEKPYPDLDRNDGRLYWLAENYFRSINGCRWALATRHAIWIEAGRSAESNLFPPVRMSNPEDFKRKLVCDYSDLDKNGAGLVHCNIDKW